MNIEQPTLVGNYKLLPDGYGISFTSQEGIGFLNDVWIKRSKKETKEAINNQAITKTEFDWATLNKIFEVSNDVYIAYDNKIIESNPKNIDLFSQFVLYLMFKSMEFADNKIKIPKVNFLNYSNNEQQNS
jgi:hypothetical protein